MNKTTIFKKDKSYLNFLSNVKSEFNHTRARSIQTVNSNLIDFYWWLGKEIVEKQKTFSWGNNVVEQLSKDLKKAFPGKTGVSPQNLWKIRKFYLEYKDLPILSQLVRELPWGHNLLIMAKVEDPKARKYYICAAKEMAWSRATLTLQIKNQSYEHHIFVSKQHNFKQALPKDIAERANKTMKDIYTFDALGLSDTMIETEIESRMVNKIKDVMLELGYGFTFLGSQYRVRQNNKDYYIDLLFYNRKLQSLVAVELKANSFKPEYAGKMNFYLNLLDDYVREAHENPSIGIILCTDLDKFEVEYTLRDINKPVGVSEFKLTKILPKALENKLPNPKILEEHIRNELGENK
jgi:predicted nuclease of restriction endonuclease-like (RecB) superfamily